MEAYEKLYEYRNFGQKNSFRLFNACQEAKQDVKAKGQSVGLQTLGLNLFSKAKLIAVGKKK